MLIKLYSNGQIIYCDHTELYDPFPEKENIPREKNEGYNERIEGDSSPSKAVRTKTSSTESFH